MINNGAKDPLANKVVSTYGVISSWGAISATTGSRSVNRVWKMSPRVDWMLHKSIKLRFEAESTAATWADAQTNGKGKDNEYVAMNHRFHLSTLFMF
ncbi:hypothetical protein [Chryseobacterium sp.]|uniref:hypothetical protein n=1 Tax=Chryseobacterium sp. TaxID=1871047 RepID=UPI00388D39A8